MPANLEDIAILTGGKLISDDLGIKLENVKWAGRRADAAPAAKRAGIPLAAAPSLREGSA